MQNPQGEVQTSCPDEYVYAPGKIASFTPDQGGAYQLRLSAELLQPDAINPSFPRSAVYVVTLMAEGGCKKKCDGEKKEETLLVGKDCGKGCKDQWSHW